MDRKASYICAHTNKPRNLPIDPTTDDPFYRYKTPQLQVQVIGKGKMIRTQFNNLEDVAKALKVCPNYIPHFFGHTLGAQAKYDPKRPPSERGSISGEYSFEDLSDVFESFINGFVLCIRCRLPEYRYDIKKRIDIICQSCGVKTNIDKLELNDKFRRFFKNHPPPQTADIRPRRDGEQQQQQQQQQQSQDVPNAADGVPPSSSSSSSSATPNGTGATNGVANDDEDTGMSEPVSDPILEEIANAKVASSEDFESSWSTDASAEAAAERARMLLPEKLRELVYPSASTGPSPTERFKQVVASGASTNDIVKQAGTISADAKLAPNDAAQLIFDGLIGTDMTSIRPNAQKHKAALSKLLNGKLAQQKAFMSSLESAYADASTSDAAAFLKQFPHVLMQLYQDDVIEEDAINAWNSAKDTDANGAALRSAAAPVVKWLADAEEESDDDE